jgi:hypothetical protein
MLTKTEKRTIKRTITRLAAGTIGVLVLFSGLALLGTLVIPAAIKNSWFEVSIDGFLALLGLLFIVCIGLYFIWVGFSILALRRISTISFTLLTVLPPLVLTFAAASLMKTFWERPAGGYSLLSLIILLTICITVFAISYAFNLKILLIIFRKGGYLET